MHYIKIQAVDGYPCQCSLNVLNGGRWAACFCEVLTVNGCRLHDVTPVKQIWKVGQRK